MLPGKLWQKELLEEWKSRKGLFIRFFIPFLILVPLAAAPVPPSARATGIAMGILFIGIFGSATGLAQIRETRMLERLLVLPVPRSRLLLEYILANSAADGLQLSIPFTIVVLSGNPHFSLAPALPLSYISAIAASNAIGTAIPVFSGSSAEVHLASFIAVFAVLSVSTPFLPALYRIGQLLPFGGFTSELMSAWGGAQIPWYSPAITLTGAVFMVGVVAACAGRLKAME